VCAHKDNKHLEVLMKVKVLSLVCGMAVCAAAAPDAAWAWNPRPSINQLERREQVRISRGIRSGELTRPEARRLEAQQGRIRVNERFARADGRITPTERHRLNTQLRHANRSIYRQKHDGQHR
jgi:hypothetical protein